MRCRNQGNLHLPRPGVDYVETAKNNKEKLKSHLPHMVVASIAEWFDYIKIIGNMPSFSVSSVHMALLKRHEKFPNLFRSSTQYGTMDHAKHCHIAAAIWWCKVKILQRIPLSERLKLHAMPSFSVHDLIIYNVDIPN